MIGVGWYSKDVVGSWVGTASPGDGGTGAERSIAAPRLGERLEVAELGGGVRNLVLVELLSGGAVWECGSVWGVG
jgi:hypothetical protein